MDGSFYEFQGPLHDQSGALKVKQGDKLSLGDILGMTWFVKGVIGSPKGYDRAEIAPAALALRGIVKRFPGVLANDRVDLEVAPGEVHALLGENGAGKSTISNVITGLYRPDAGEMRMDGGGWSSTRRATRSRRGSSWSTSTSASCRPSRRPRTSCSASRRAARGASGSTAARSSARWPRSPSAMASRSTPARAIWQLSVGEQQRVEILKVLYRDARVLILDEPTAVLTPQEADGAVRGTAADDRRGQDGHLRHAQARRGDGGRRPRDGAARRPQPRHGAHRGHEPARARAADGRARGALRAPRARGRRRGRRPGARRRRRRRATAACPRCTTSRWTVRAGEIVGVAGVAGNGQRELAEAIAGRGRARPGPSRSPGARCPAATRATRSPRASATCPRTACTRPRAKPVDRREPRAALLPAAADGARVVPAPPAGSARTPRSSSSSPTSARPRPEHAARLLSGGNVQKVSWRVSSRGARRCSSSRRRRAGSTSAPPSRCAALLCDRRARGRRRAADLRGPRRAARCSPTASRSCTPAASSASSTPRRPTRASLGLLMAGGRAEGAVRILRFERRLVTPPWLALAVPFGSIVAALADHRRDPRRHRRRPVRRLPAACSTARYVGDGALSSMLVTATPLIFTGLAAAAAFRMRHLQHRRRGPALRGRDRGGLGGLELADSGTAVRSSGWRSRASPPACCGRRSPACSAPTTGTSELITSLMLNYIGRPAADVPDLRLALLLARHDVGNGRIFPTARRWPTRRTGRRSHVARPRDRARGDRAGAAGEPRPARLAGAPRRRAARAAAALAHRRDPRARRLRAQRRADERHAGAVGGLPLRLLDRADRRARGLGALPLTRFGYRSAWSATRPPPRATRGCARSARSSR